MYLWLSATWVGNKEGTVVGDESSLELVLCVLVDVLLVVGNEGLGDSLTDGVDLGSVTTTGDANADINTSELVEADNQKRLVKLFANMSERVPSISSQFPPPYSLFDSRVADGCTLKRRISGWMRLSGLPLTLTRPFPAYTESQSALHFVFCRRRISSHLALGNCGGSLLLAEALNALRCRGHVCDWRDSGICRE